MKSYQPRPELSGIDTAGPAQDRYEVIGRIASGAMGQVYLARMRRRSGRAKEVALKRIRPELQLEKDVVAMFYDEAHIASKMDHPNIIRIYELGELDGSLFIAMELIEGVNLSGLLRHLVESRRQLPGPVMFKIALDILDALDYAHRFTDASGRPLNIVHRDVSPQNIMLSYAGDVKLFDFGVTKAEGRLHKTHPGLLKGKLAYMAPEQIRADESIDARADLFSLGVLLYEALLYRHPFYGKTDAMVLRAIMESDPIDPSDINPRFPRELTEILFTSLAKDPASRFSDAREMSEALEGYLARRHVTTSRPMLAEYLHSELSDRSEALARARHQRDDKAIVEALRGGPAMPSTPPKPALPAPAARRGLLPAPRASLRPSDRSSSDSPSPLGVQVSTTRLHLAEAATGDLPLPEETADIAPLSRSSMDDVLEDALSREADQPPAQPRTIGPYAVRDRIDDPGPFDAFAALKYGPRGFTRAVTLLCVPQRSASDRTLVDSIVRAAKTASAWTHPNLVASLDFGGEENYHWAVERTVGHRLDTLIDRARSRGRSIPLGAVCRIGAQLCSALLHVHQHASGAHVHLDVAPYNVTVHASGMIKVGGFAYVSPVGTVREMPRRFSHEYVAPEIVGGEAPTFAADVYGVGRIIDECLTLTAQFRGGAPDNSMLPSLATRRRDAPDRLVRVVDACMSPSPGDRGSNLAEIQNEIEATLVDLAQCFSTRDLAEWLSSLYT